MASLASNDFGSISMATKTFFKLKPCLWTFTA